MTNEEKANAIANDMTLPWVKLGKPYDAISQACIEMADWKDEQYSTFYQYAVACAKTDFINEASMWLKYNASKFVYNSSHNSEAKINESKLAEEFVKAMED